MNLEHTKKATTTYSRTFVMISAVTVVSVCVLIPDISITNHLTELTKCRGSNIL
jgi:hypothetical protein